MKLPGLGQVDGFPLRRSSITRGVKDCVVSVSIVVFLAFVVRRSCYPIAAWLLMPFIGGTCLNAPGGSTKWIWWWCELFGRFSKEYLGKTIRCLSTTARLTNSRRLSARSTCNRNRLRLWPNKQSKDVCVPDMDRSQRWAEGNLTKRI